MNVLVCGSRLLCTYGQKYYWQFLSRQPWEAGLLEQNQEWIKQAQPKTQHKRQRGAAQAADSRGCRLSVSSETAGPFAWRCSCLQCSDPEERKRKPKVGLGLIGFPFGLPESFVCFVRLLYCKAVGWAVSVHTQLLGPQPSGGGAGSDCTGLNY